MNAHNDFHYTTLGEIVISGRYRRFADLTATILERLGGILHNLEEDIAAHYSANHPFPKQSGCPLYHMVKNTHTHTNTEAAA